MPQQIRVLSALIVMFALNACREAPETVPPTFVVDYSLVPRATYGSLPLHPTVTPGGGSTVSYERDIQPLFNRSCLNCHGGIAGMWLTDYEHVMAGSINGWQVVAGDPEASTLYTYVRDGLMPPIGTKVAPDELERLRRWIAEGAVKN